MISFGHRANSDATRRDIPLRDKSIAKKSEWMTNGEDPHFSPTVFLIEQPPNSTITAHFHHNNQFQVFVRGGGKIGPRAVPPVTVHYAGAYTGYGPLVAGIEGLQYFTLRTVHEKGAIRVADSDGRWPQGPRRHATSKPIEMLDSAELRELTSPVSTVLLPRADDGLASTSVALPPNGVLPLVEIGVGEGVFILILTGGVQVGGERLAADESIYVSTDEPFPTITAGEAGAQIVTLIPPRRDPAYG